MSETEEAYPLPETIIDLPLRDARSADEARHERPSFCHSLFEAAMTFCFPLVLGAVLYQAYAQLARQGRGWALWLALPIGWVLGDFVTGAVHWAADTYGTADTFLVGKNFVQPFREHHERPRAICEHNLFVTIGNTCILGVPLLGACWWLVARDEETKAPTAFAVAVVALMTATAVATNLFHKWAHAEKTSWLIRALQRANLILRPEHHDRHHCSPHDNSYCITNGWCNPLLDRVRLFRRAEKILAAVGVERSRRDEKD